METKKNATVRLQNISVLRRDQRAGHIDTETWNIPEICFTLLENAVK